MKQFLDDIKPFFFRRPIVYVDVGAYRGESFEAVLESRIPLAEAHLFEPNPESFPHLDELVRRHGETRNLTRVSLHHAALGAREGTLAFQAGGGMTRALDAVPEDTDAKFGRGKTFEAPCRRLDDVVAQFFRKHISVLKIDVEGSELEVLRGAEALLRSQSIDVINIEAGVDSETTQQTYYRRIEDELGEYGYRLFKVYEQQHEWFEDSPLLRRVNLAFMSARFAEANPMRLSKEVFARVEELAALKAKAKDAAAERAALEEKLTASERQRVAGEAKARERITALEASLAASEAYTRAAMKQVAATERRLGETIARQGTLEAESKRLRADKASLKAERDRLRAKRDAARADLARLRSSRSWRVTAPLRAAKRKLVALRRRLRAKSESPARAAPKPRGAARGAPKSSTDAATGNARSSMSAKELNVRLWGGFSRSALQDLRALVHSRETAPKARGEAAWVLARWHASGGDFRKALDEIVLARTASPALGAKVQLSVLEARCLREIGHLQEARVLLDAILANAPKRDPYLLLARANAAPLPGEPEWTDAADDERLRYVNEVFLGKGLAPVEKADPTRPLSIANLAASGVGRIKGTGLPLISVIMPVYNAESTIRFALSSLLAQSWPRLEIIVVDDCSTDGTLEVVEAIAAIDERVVLLRNAENLGAYRARNAGLARARGDFITVHDSDDWSHPQKIETLLRFLQSHPEKIAAHSQWARVSEDLLFIGGFRSGAQLILPDVSSLMVRREAFDRVGAWQPVRVSGDTEYLRRLQAVYGESAVETTLHKDTPLAFALTRPSALTRQSATHVATIFHGLRREYREMVQWWHETASDPADLRVEMDGSELPLPLPRGVTTWESGAVQCDILVIMDFVLTGGAFVSTLNYILAAIQAGKRVAVFNWRRYDLDPRRPLNPTIRSMAAKGNLQIVVPGEEVVTETVIVGYPPILQHMIDRPPYVTGNHVVVVVNQMASRLYDGGDPQYDPRVARAHLEEIFGQEGIWTPISGLVRRLMLEDERYPEPSPHIWTPLIDTDSYGASAIRWRGGERGAPVIGRHGRDHYTKWPTTPDAIAHAYCADRECEVRILGGAEHPARILGRIPSNWRVMPFGSVDALDFLRDIDVFIHYPHENYIEEFGRAVIEAMAAGKPVILPPVFSETFGDAVLYTEPDGVWSLVCGLWEKESFYRERAEIGRGFVLNNCGLKELEGRLANLPGHRDLDAVTSVDSATDVPRNHQDTRADA